MGGGQGEKLDRTGGGERNMERVREMMGQQGEMGKAWEQKGGRGCKEARLATSKGSPTRVPKVQAPGRSVALKENE